MDTILSLLILIGIGIGWHFLKVTVFAAGRAMTTGGSFGENFDIALNGMKPLEMRMVDVPADPKTETPAYSKLEVKGLLPIKSKTRLAFVTSIVDSTTAERYPIISMLEDFQEKATTAYQHVVEVGAIDSGKGFVQWVRVGLVLPGVLQAPFKGPRILTVVLRLVDLDQPFEIDGGFHTGEPAGLLWGQGVKIVRFEDNGWAEAIMHEDEAQALTIQLAVAVAMSKGGLDDSEGEAIKLWMQKMLATAKPSARERKRSAFNGAFKNAYEAAQKGELVVSTIAGRLESIADKRLKYNAIELCYDVMAADGKADSDELKTIRNIASSLKLDYDEIARMKDQRMVKVNVSDSSDASVDEILGIRADWGRDQINAHLRTEFQKWNNRLNSLPEGPERDNAQKMLEMIANARKKSA